MLTVVGEIASSEQLTYTDRRTGRPAYRLETVLRTDGPALRMTFFAKNQAPPQWQQRRLPAGASRALPRQGGQFRGDVAADQPRDGALRRRRRGRGRGRLAARRDRRLYPIYPLTKGVESWDLQRAVTFARSVVDDLPEVIPEPVRARVRRSRRAPGLRLDPRPRRLRPGRTRPTPVPLRGGAGHPARAGAGAGARPRARAPAPATAATARCWRAFDARLPFDAHRGQREVGARDRGRPRAAAPDEPAAAGRGRLRQDPGRAARDAAGRRLRRPGRAARADRGARPAAPPLDHRDARRPRRRRDARRRRRGAPGSSC